MAEIVYLVCSGNGEDGNEWYLNSVHRTEEGAEAVRDTLNLEATYAEFKVEEWILQA